MINQYIDELIKTLDKISPGKIIEVAEMITECREEGGVVFTCGNGHGLMVAEAFALDLVKHAGVAAIPLSSPAFITAYSNDGKYDHAFASHYLQLCNRDDLVIGFTFSGSENILQVAESAGRSTTKSIIITSACGKSHGTENLKLQVPSDNIQVVEDVWSSIGHMIANEVRARVLDNG